MSSNYPDGIHRYDNDPRSPFFVAPPEPGEEDMKEALKAFLLEDTNALLLTLSERGKVEVAHCLLIAAITGEDDEVKKFSQELRPVEGACYEKYGEKLAASLRDDC